MRRIALTILVLLALAAAGFAGLTTRALHAIRGVRPALPDVEVLLRVDTSADLPSDLLVLPTAEQPMPRAAVLDAARDPHPDVPYVMTHPSFALIWPDGRIFLIDAGMGRAAAAAFGRPIEIFSGASPIRAHGGAAEQLASDVARVRGIAFTHLHTDHTDGLSALCDALDRALPVFQTPEQRGEGNYTTRSGRVQIADAACAEPVLLEGAAPHAIPGFPGLFAIAAAGHTPGSQIFIAHLRGADGDVRILVFTGDVVNHRDAVPFDLPKPPLYSRWIVPEDTERLATLRAFLAQIAERPGVALVVSHDTRDLPAL